MRPQKHVLKRINFDVMLTLLWRNKTRLDSMRADVCVIKVYRLMPPFGKWLTAPVVCLSVCVCEHPSPHQYIPSPLCLRLHCMSPSLSQTKTNRALWSLHTHIPTTHPSINPHTQCTYSTVKHQHHPRTLSQTCIWHEKTRRTHIWARSHKQMRAHKEPLAHALAFLTASSHEYTDISTCVSKNGNGKKKRQGGSNSEKISSGAH